MSLGRLSKFIITLLTMSVLLVGCSQTRNNTPPNSPANVTPTKPATRNQTDGTIASMTPITDFQAQIGSDVKLYKMFYWSHGLKIEAFLTEPSKLGKYPLFVNLHGGAAWLEGTSTFGYSAQTVAALANPSMVMVYPEYEGYMASQGLVHGMKNDTLDVLNAISAAESLGEVSQNDTYLLGYSLGGGLALMTAAADHDVKAVVSVSPFVGLNDFVSWAKTNAKHDSIFYGQLRAIEESYGSNVRSVTYNERSPDITKIDAPVLLLQGTADQHVPWQTVRTFTDQMKSAHKVVKLVIYPNGHHGLHNVNGSASTQEIANWFAQYGLNTVAITTSLWDSRAAAL